MIDAAVEVGKTLLTILALIAALFVAAQIRACIYRWR